MSGSYGQSWACEESERVGGEVVTGPDQGDVDQLRELLDLMVDFPSNDQRARFLLSSNWLRDRDARVVSARLYPLLRSRG